MRPCKLREDHEGRHIVAAIYATATLGHKNPLEAVQVYGLKSQKITIVSMGCFEEKDFLTPYEGYEIADELNAIFGTLSDKAGQGRKSRWPSQSAAAATKKPLVPRPRSQIGSEMFWLVPTGSEDEAEVISSMTITGIDQPATKHLFSGVLQRRNFNALLSFAITNMTVFGRASPYPCWRLRRRLTQAAHERMNSYH